jgi:phosphoribosylanthranilate isomerase
MIVQIYEIQDPYEAEKCLDAGVDHIGSVLSAEGPLRMESIREVSRLVEGSDAKHSIIPLFSFVDDIYRALDYYRPAFVHFCEDIVGPEGRMLSFGPFLELQEAVRDKFPEIRIIRTIPVPETGGTELDSAGAARQFQQLSDVILVDTWIGKPPVAGFVGITGRTADRAISRDVAEAVDIPVILAGGLDPHVVYETALEVAPAGVDSCTGTNFTDGGGESIRFKKDFEKVKSFVDEARRAAAELDVMLQKETDRLASARAELEELEKALPAHSVNPSHMLRIEELEEQLDALQRRISVLGRAVALSI